MPDSTSNLQRVLSIEHTQQIGISADGHAERGSEIYLKEFKGMIDSGLMARMGNAAFKILHALGLRARVLGDPFYPGAEDEFLLLVRMEIIKPGDRGKLFCFVGREQIAEDTGIRSVNTVDAALDELIALHLIERLTPKQPRLFKGNTTNRLRLHRGRFSSNYYIIREESYIRKFDHQGRAWPSKDAHDSHQDQKSRVVNEQDDQDQKLILVDSTTRDLPKLVNRALISTTTTIDAIDVNSQIATVFAKAIGVERYDPTEREKRQIAALRADGFSIEAVGSGIQRAVQFAAARGKSVRTLTYCVPEIRNPQIAATDAGTPKPAAETGTPPIESGSRLDDAPAEGWRLANGDAELRELLVLVQTKNARLLDAGDANAWSALRDESWVIELARKKNLSPCELVQKAVREAIGAGSVTKDFLAPNLARRILETWQENGNGSDASTAVPTKRKAHSRPQTAARPSGLQYNSLAEYEADLERQAQRTKGKTA